MFKNFEHAYIFPHFSLTGVDLGGYDKKEHYDKCYPKSEVFKAVIINLGSSGLARVAS
jgi:hypothetical protein